MKTGRRVIAGAIVAAGVAFSAPAMAISTGCALINTGALSLTGQPVATQTTTVNLEAGETVTGTLAPNGGTITNSLLTVDGNPLLSGATSGAVSLIVAATTAYLIAVDIQGAGLVQLLLSCTPVPPTTPTTPTTGGTPTTPAPIGSAEANNTLAVAILSSPYGQLARALDPALFNALARHVAAAAASCAVSAERAAQIAAIRKDLKSEDLALAHDYESLSEFTSELKSVQKFSAEYEGKLLVRDLAGGRVSDQESEIHQTSAALYKYAQARVRFLPGQIADVEASIEKRSKRIAELTAELERLQRCEFGNQTQAAIGPVASQFAPRQATPAILGPNGPLFAFAGSSDRPVMFGSAKLVDDPKMSLWISGDASAVLNGGPAGVGGMRGNMTLNGAWAVDAKTGIGAQVGVSAGQSRIGASTTTNDFVNVTGLVMASHAMAQDVNLAGGLFAGYGWNAINIAGATGNFTSAQVGSFAQLSGDLAVEEFILTPSGNVVISHLVTSAYTNSAAVVVPSTSNTQLQSSVALRISRPIFLTDPSVVLTPFVEGSISYAFNTSPTLTLAPGTILALNVPAIGVAAGARIELESGVFLSFRGALDGIGSGVISAGLSGMVGGTF